MTEACSHLYYNMLPVPYDYASTKLWLMKLFSNCATGAYFVQSNTQPSIGDQVHHALAVHAMKPLTMRKLPSAIVAIVTDNSGVMGYVQKEDVDDKGRKESGVVMFYKFLGLNDAKIACVCGIAPRNHTTSTYYQAKVVASDLCNKRFTRNSLKSLILPPVTSVPVSSTKINLASSTTITNRFRSKHIKDKTCSSIKKNFRRRRRT